jgi:ABC-2 type transport system permease protein
VRTVAELTRLELKLFIRDPMTVLFSLALPVIVLLILGGVFGNEPGELDTGGPVYRGVGAMDYYVPAYVALVVVSVCLISVPAHLAGNRERGVLRRYHASSITAWQVAMAELGVAIVISAVSVVVLLVTATIVYDFVGPWSIPIVLLGFVTSTLAFSTLGVLLGAVLPTARSAQALGMLLWFVMLFLGGAGPPPEVLTDAMRAISTATPMWHAVRVMQHGWLELDPDGSWLILLAIVAIGAPLAVRAFRWE